MKTFTLSAAKCRRLPIRVRIALGAHLCDGVLAFYSDYFVKKYKGKECIDIAWNYALGKRIKTNNLKEAIKSTTEMIPEAEAEGYGRWELATSILLLSEIQEGNGKNLSLTVDACAIVYGKRVLYSLGISPTHPKLSNLIEIVDELGNPVFRNAKDAFDLARTKSEKDVSRKMFSDIVLHDPADRSEIPPELLRMSKSRNDRYLPPKHETLKRG